MLSSVYWLKYWSLCLTVNANSLAKVSGFMGVTVFSRCSDIQDEIWSPLQLVPPIINVLGIPSSLCRSAAHCHDVLLGYFRENLRCFCSRNTDPLSTLCQHVAMGSLSGVFKDFHFCPTKGSGACLHHSIVHLQHYSKCSVRALLNQFRKIHFWRVIQTLFKLEITSAFHAWGFVIRTTRTPRHK